MSRQGAVLLVASSSPHAAPASHVHQRSDLIVDDPHTSPPRFKIHVNRPTSGLDIRDRDELVVPICQGHLLGPGEPTP
jgi:hypothetical protein